MSSITFYLLSQNSSDEALIRSFQLAFSLRNIALKQEGKISKLLLHGKLFLVSEPGLSFLSKLEDGLLCELCIFMIDKVA
jgi:hypothetical protein